MSDPERLELIENRLAIADLVNTYAQAVDQREGSLAASLFAEDGELIISGVLSGAPMGGTTKGREKIERALTRLDLYRLTFHQIATHSVRFIAPAESSSFLRATSQTGAVAHHISGPESEEIDRVWLINYFDELVRLPEGWRFARRRLQVELESEHPLRRHSP
jgi:uncharacterized protein (TIGR02246 family)